MPSVIMMLSWYFFSPKQSLAQSCPAFSGLPAEHKSRNPCFEMPWHRCRLRSSLPSKQLQQQWALSLQHLHEYSSSSSYTWHDGKNLRKRVRLLQGHCSIREPSGSSGRKSGGRGGQEGNTHLLSPCSFTPHKAIGGDIIFLIAQKERLAPKG